MLILAAFAAGGGASSAAAADECPNAAFRTGPAADLSDCRAYELVSPAGLTGAPNAAVLGNSGAGSGGAFPTELVSPPGDSVVFMTSNGAIPGVGEPNGNQDYYVASRGPGGWIPQHASPSGAQAAVPSGGAFSSTLRYSLWSSGGLGGSLDVAHGLSPLSENRYLRAPDGSFEYIGRGSLGSDPTASGRWIAPDAGRVVFTTVQTDCAGGCPVLQLEPDASPAGTDAIYDRIPGGATHVVSLLPGDVTPAAGEDAIYQGASKDGTAVAFKIGAVLYVRIDNTTTEQVVAAPNTFAGVSTDGSRVFYADAAPVSANSNTAVPADLFSFDTATQVSTPITNVGDALFVNVSANGSRVYFVSEFEIGGGEAGEPNLYVWDESTATTEFVATLDPEDVSGEFNLTRWTDGPVAPNVGGSRGPGRNPSRTTPDGSVIAFESDALLDPVADAGASTDIHVRGVGDPLPTCVSCEPGGEPSLSDDRFLKLDNPTVDAVNVRAVVHNLSIDGSSVFFESRDPLLNRDIDGLNDVYEWREGAGLSLISSGQSTEGGPPGVAQPNLIYAIDPSGDNVVFRTLDVLTESAGGRGFPLLYDARVGGGLSPEDDAGCSGDACQGGPSGSPDLPRVGSVSAVGGNVRGGHRCRPLARRAKRLSQRAKRARRNAARISTARRAKRLRRRSTRLARGAKRLSERASRCRRADRRVAR